MTAFRTDRHKHLRVTARISGLSRKVTRREEVSFGLRVSSFSALNLIYYLMIIIWPEKCLSDG